MESKSKVERYLLESFENSIYSNFNILSWWETNSSKYRIISSVAWNMLVIPILLLLLNPNLAREGVCAFRIGYFLRQYQLTSGN